MIYYSIAMAAFVGICVGVQSYGLAAFSFTVMVGTLLTAALGAQK